MIDLHCHILPGIDDGPATMEESLELARALLADGVRTVAATPHVRWDHPRVVPEELDDRCDELARSLSATGIAVELVRGGELDLLWAVEASDEDLRLVSLDGGRSLLVETPYGQLVPAFEPVLLRLQERGFLILLAHPERSPSFQSNPERLAGLVAEGVLIQVTAESLARGSGSRALAQRLVQRGLTHVIASDHHGPNTPGRALLSEGIEAAADAAGRARARWMATDSPAAVLAGEPADGPEPQAPRRSSWFRR